MWTTAFLFPGQGAFLGGALTEAALVYPQVQATLDTIEAVALARFNRSLAAVLHDPEASAESLLATAPDLLQLGIFALSIAAFRVLESEDIVPDLLAGHSLGEIAALTCAGVFTERQGAELVCDRIAALAAAPRGACMAALATHPRRVRDLLDRLPAGLGGAADVPAIAVENHDGQTVVSGGERAIARLLDDCRHAGIGAQRLNAPHGFHHPALAAAAADFERRLRAYPTGRLALPVYSPILGRLYADGDAFGHLLARHLVLPVAFSAALRTLHAGGLRRIVECGAFGTLGKIAIRVLGPGTVQTFVTFTSHTASLHNLRHLTQLRRQEQSMNAPLAPAALFTDFESFWNERSPFLMGQIKNEFLRFIEADEARRADVPASPTMASAPAPAPAPAPPVRAPIPRPQLFGELIAIYAEAMEYPTEVFTETIELEAELGIDSVKQTEIIGRISSAYGLPPLPANFRSGDFKTMGQIVDFVFAQQGNAVPA